MGAECTKKSNRKPVILFSVLPDPPSAQLKEPFLALTKRTKTKAYIQIKVSKGETKQKALEGRTQLERRKIRSIAAVRLHME